jgi:hypothetical protein
MRFDGAGLEALQDALCDAFDFRSLVAMVSHGFGKRVAAKLGETTLEGRAFDLIEWAGSEDRHDQLVRVARRANLGNQKLRDIEKKLGSIQTEHLNALEAILVTPRLGRKDIVALGNALDTHLPPPTTGNEGARAAFRRTVDRLANRIKKSDGSLPLVSFAIDLANLVGLEPEVRAWSGTLPIAVSVCHLPAPMALYLFVKCDSGFKEHVTEADDVGVDMWLWRLDANGKPLGGGPKRVCDHTQVSFGEVPALVSAVRKKLSAELEGAKDNLVVAFCLPEAALAIEVERWPIQVGKTARAIARDYPVVIRSFERLYQRERRDTWGRWNRRWEQLVNARGNDLVSWFCESMASDEFIDEIQRRDDVICAALTHGDCALLVACTIDEGIPAVVWTRSAACDATTLRAHIEALTGGELRDLPRLLHRARKLTGGPLDKVALLWDEYDRLPPDADRASAFIVPEPQDRG